MIIAGFEDLGEIPEEGDRVRGTSKDPGSHPAEFEGVVTLVFMAMDTPCLNVMTATRTIHVFPEWDAVELVQPA